MIFFWVWEETESFDAPEAASQEMREIGHKSEKKKEEKEKEKEKNWQKWTFDT